LFDLALLLFGIYLGLTYIRFLCLLAFLGSPFFARLLDSLPPYRPDLDKPVLNAFMMAFIAVGTLTFSPPLGQASLEDMVAKEYPAAILPRLRERPPDGPLLNFYAWGGYLGWHNRDLKVFIDGRADIFEFSGAFQDYIDLVSLKMPEEILDKHGIRHVLFPPGQSLTYVLEHSPRWTVTYRDEVSVLLSRND
jgi:hypothetical protein